MTSFSGCVLPVGPRFEDPPAVENFPPTIISSLPLQGSTVTAVNGTQTLTVTATDPNVGDHLYARWIGEYPPYSAGSNLLKDDVPFPPSLNGQPLNANPGIDISCLNPLARTNQHTITLLVSDREFWTPGAPGAPTDRDQLLTTNSQGTQMAEANWVLNLPCQ